MYPGHSAAFPIMSGYPTLREPVWLLGLSLSNPFLSEHSYHGEMPEFPVVPQTNDDKYHDLIFCHVDMVIKGPLYVLHLLQGHEL